MPSAQDSPIVTALLQAFKKAGGCLRLTGSAARFYISENGRASAKPVFGVRFVAENKKNQKELVGFVGVGLDNKDGHKRLTRTKSFVLIGGSEETHEKMQEVSIRFNEALAERGKELGEASVDEVSELMHKAMDD
jgi:hypothetical protein